MRRLMLVIVALGLIAPEAARAAITCPSSSAIATRSSGTAPLFVFFDASGNNGSGDASTWNQDSTLTATANQSFTDLHYAWNFNDPGAGTWVTDGTSRNVADGPLAAHLFETAGSYAPTLTITNASGQSCSVTLSTITVANANTTWSGTVTACISSSGNFTGCPAGASQTTSSNWDSALSSAISGGARRILYRAGDSFNMSNTSPYTVATPGPGMIGTFGSGNANVTLTSGGSCLTMNASDWRLANQNFNNSGTVSSGSNCVNTTNYTVNPNIVVMRNTISGGFQGGIDFDPWIVPKGQEDQFAEIENRITPPNSASAAYGTYLGLHHSALLGNTIDGRQLPQASAGGPIRIGCFVSSVFAHNVVNGAQAGRQTFKMHAESNSNSNNVCQNSNSGVPAPPTNQFFEISDNVFYETSSAWDVAIDPQNTIQNEYTQDGIFERNLLDLTANGNAASALEINAERVTIRNNIFRVGTTMSGFTAVHINRRNNQVPTDHIANYSNTMYQSGSTSGNTFIQSDTTVVNSNQGGAVDSTTVRNNLLYAPGVSATLYAPTGTTNSVSDHNLSATSNPFINTNFTVGRDFQLATGSAALGTGAPLGQPPNVPVMNDFGLVLRPSPPSVGAWDSTSTVTTLTAPGQPTLMP
jgi:hypothetical protein